MTDVPEHLTEEVEKRKGTGTKYNTRLFLETEMEIRRRLKCPRKSRRHDSLESFKQCLDDYLLYCHENDAKPTFGMLARWSGVGADKERFFNRYGKEYEKAYEDAEEVVASYYEHLATDGATAGAAFVLKNRRRKYWNDDKTVDLKSTDGSVSPSVFKGVTAQANDDSGENSDD